MAVATQPAAETGATQPQRHVTCEYTCCCGARFWLEVPPGAGNYWFEKFLNLSTAWIEAHNHKEPRKP